MSQHTGFFDRFAKKREELLEMCNETIEIAKSLGQHEKCRLLMVFRDKLRDDRFRLVVLGSFKRGKSTFINAMLGSEVLPNYAVPCTAIINEVKWGDDKNVRIHFKQPIPDSLPDKLAPEAVEHIRKHSASDAVPPLDVPFDKLEYYVVIPDPAKDQADGIAETPFDHAEIFWPLDLCKNNIEIIDSPGLDEHASRTKVTEQYLTQADVILFVQSCAALAGATEMSFIENNLHCNGFEEIIFVCNRFDEVRERERDRVKEFGRTKLGAVTKLGSERGVFFLSAADALDGRVENKDEYVQRSGMLEFERMLFQYLVENRGRLKLLQPARKLSTELFSLTDEIRGQRKLSHENLESLKAKEKFANEAADIARKQIEQMKKENDLKRRDIVLLY